MDTAYEHLTALDDPERPWRRIWRCPATGVFVKTYAKRRAIGFGRIAFDITGSLCDAGGKAEAFGEGRAVLDFKHLLQIEPHADANIADDLDRELRFMVARVERAALNERTAAQLG